MIAKEPNITNMIVDAIFLQSKFNRKLNIIIKQTVEWALGNR